LEAQATDFEERFSAALDLFAADPSADTGYAIGYVTVNCAALCRLRDRCLQAAGFGDIFETVKSEENEKALRVLPGKFCSSSGPINPAINNLISWSYCIRLYPSTQLQHAQIHIQT
jgi:hypothetical protein